MRGGGAEGGRRVSEQFRLAGGDGFENKQVSVSSAVTGNSHDACKHSYVWGVRGACKVTPAGPQRDPPHVAQIPDHQESLVHPF